MIISKTFAVTSDDIRTSRLARDILNCIRPLHGTVFIEKNDRKIQANTLIGILSLGIQLGDKLKFSCSGDDEGTTELFFEKVGALLA